ncbi:TRAP transporter substrate-binding protein [Gelria sp. Kuro-4]|uniref:TRAP transporter substrate-binding protein n=1 Tax=Gelria sp. Kuro-4 TaxID=2796927 RepID=UPI001BEEB0D7|nr:TRAP transporter substrate-binding protein [Gelria sp. Kuro-4]BCV24597.1 C4-dicarboxylate ABC transporter substrate-binding protein [Gelria sp. Kuro-4]
MKRFKLVLRMIALGLALGLAVTGCGSKQSADQSQDKQGESGSVTVNLRLGHDQTTDTPYQVAAEDFANAVAEKTNGKVKIEIYPGATLGDELSMLDSLRLGDLDFSIAAAPNAASHIPELGFFGVGYLFKDYDHFRKAMTDQTIIDRVANLAAEKNLGFKFLGFLTTGARSLYSIKPIRTPDDMKGVKMRVMASPVEAKVWGTLGSLPVSIPFGEVYSALQTGVAAAAENTPLVYVANKHQEVAPYLDLTEHQYMVSTLWVSDKTWEKLPEDVRKAVVAAAKEMTDTQIQQTQKDEAKLLEEAGSKGVKVIRDVDKQAFIDKVLSLQDEIAKEMKLDDILARIRELGQ